MDIKTEIQWGVEKRYLYRERHVETFRSIIADQGQRIERLVAASDDLENELHEEKRKSEKKDARIRLLEQQVKDAKFFLLQADERAEQAEQSG